MKRGFASDNNSGVHPDILKAIGNANNGHCVGYGDDSYTIEAKETFKSSSPKHFLFFWEREPMY